jgi:hypothetical protein
MTNETRDLGQIREGDWIIWASLGNLEKVGQVIQVFRPVFPLAGGSAFMVRVREPTADDSTVTEKSVYEFEIRAAGASPLEMLARA